MLNELVAGIHIPLFLIAPQQRRFFLLAQRLGKRAAAHARHPQSHEQAAQSQQNPCRQHKNHLRFLAESYAAAARLYDKTCGSFRHKKPLPPDAPAAGVFQKTT